MPRPREIATSNSVGTFEVNLVSNDINANIPRAFLRYLGVRPGDRLQVSAKDGQIVISRVVTSRLTVLADRFTSHRRSR